MSRIDKRALTKLEIIRVASKLFLENGYSNTAIKAICNELDMSPGNVTFYFPSKEHLLAELVDMLCNFQWKLLEKEADNGYSPVMAICLELTAMATMCEDDEIAKDFYLSAYSSPICLDIIRRNDAERAKEIFREFKPDWTDEQFAEAEILVSGIEYATLATAGNPICLETRISGALNNILQIFGIPEELRQQKIQRVFALDYRSIGNRVLSEFKKYVDKANEQALRDLLKNKGANAKPCYSAKQIS
ncbi:MAG: TetR/AcrR family transcriptional regulator [Clostridia bacterium]|nr:TetR/AcrR family transcriptional regulator [Clostridia bacterium]